MTDEFYSKWQVREMVEDAYRKDLMDAALASLEFITEESVWDAIHTLMEQARLDGTRSGFDEGYSAATDGDLK